MYLGALVVGLCVSYLGLLILFRAFFQSDWGGLRFASMRSIVFITALTIVSYGVSISIQDAEVSNRVLHALGGGFVAYFVCFRVAKDARLQINQLQFFVFSALIVTAMGVGNEVAEFVLQNYTELVFADSINDTWLDLISNSVGILAAAVLCSPFLHSQRNSSQ